MANFLYVMNNFAPQINTVNSIEQVIGNIETIQDLDKLIDSSRISGRTICCYLGFINLQNIYGLKLENKALAISISKEETDSELDNCLRSVKESWSGYINKVYCLE